MKRCIKCKRLLSVNYFYKSNLNKDGLRGECKNCVNRRLKEWYSKNKKHVRQRAKGYRLKIKIEVLGHYASGLLRCACCGDSHIEFLSIDHIDGGGTKHRKKIRISGNKFYFWLRRNNYPKGYRVLCNNCNMAFGAYGYCPHRSGEIK